MKRVLLLIVMACWTFANTSSNTQKISVQLLWKHQFEFAGFYIAKELGYYKDAGLDVEIKEYQLVQISQMM